MGQRICPQEGCRTGGLVDNSTYGWWTKGLVDWWTGGWYLVEDQFHGLSGTISVIGTHKLQQYFGLTPISNMPVGWHFRIS